jgi:2-haloacid dehalogenase
VKAPRLIRLSAIVLTCVAATLSGRVGESDSPRFKTVAFDYLVLFNPDSIVPSVEREFPGNGTRLTERWRSRQFEYTWIDHGSLC